VNETKYEVQDTGLQATMLGISGCVFKVSPLHCIGFTCRSLAVRKYASIVAWKRVIFSWFGKVEN